MKWILGIAAVMLIAHLWYRREARRLALEAEPAPDSPPPKDGDLDRHQ